MRPNRISHERLNALYLRVIKHIKTRIINRTAEIPAIHQLIVRTIPTANPPIKKKNDIEAKLVLIKLSSNINLIIALSVFIQQ